MNCPSCSYSMHPVMESGVEVDICEGCHGIWLDAGELNALVQFSDFLSGVVRVEHLEGELACPRCLVCDFKTVHSTIGYFSKCTVCGGTFVDCHTFQRMRSFKKRGYLARAGRGLLTCWDMLKWSIIGSQ